MLLRVLLISGVTHDLVIEAFFDLACGRRHGLHGAFIAEHCLPMVIAHLHPTATSDTRAAIRFQHELVLALTKCRRAKHQVTLSVLTGLLLTVTLSFLDLLVGNTDASSWNITILRANVPII